mgnify:CR=1 FL=1
MGRRVIYLLALVVFVQTIYPITMVGEAGLLFYQLCYAALITVGILVARRNPLYTRLLIVLGGVYLLAGIAYTLNPGVEWIVLLTYVVLIPFQATVIWVLFRFIFLEKQVTRDVIYAAIAVYLLLGAIFVPVYGLIDELTYLQTGTNAFSDGLFTDDAVFPWQNLVYYSYATLTTLGYGDVLPVTMVARSVVSMEAVIGVLFVTIIMARLVALYVAPVEDN